MSDQDLQDAIFEVRSQAAQLDLQLNNAMDCAHDWSMVNARALSVAALSKVIQSELERRRARKH